MQSTSLSEQPEEMCQCKFTPKQTNSKLTDNITQSDADIAYYLAEDCAYRCQKIKQLKPHCTLLGWHLMKNKIIARPKLYYR